jgi:hypothetical protein
MLNYICGFFQGIFFGLFLGFINGLIAAYTIRIYMPEIKAFIEHTLKAFS